MFLFHFIFLVITNIVLIGDSCSYLEPSFDPFTIEDWFGLWLAQMSGLAKPGAEIFVGAVIETIDAGPFGRITPEWWAEAAKSDEFGWGIDPLSVRVENLRSPLLLEEWGPRYNVYMNKESSN